MKCWPGSILQIERFLCVDGGWVIILVYCVRSGRDVCYIRDSILGLGLPASHSFSGRMDGSRDGKQMLLVAMYGGTLRAGCERQATADCRATKQRSAAGVTRRRAQTASRC